MSSWYREKKHGLFTYFLLKAFQGDADANHDGKVTIKELRDYLTTMVPKWALKETGHTQNPQIMSTQDDKEILKLK